MKFAGSGSTMTALVSGGIDAGNQTISLQYVGSRYDFLSGLTADCTVTVSKATPIVTAPTATNGITYGQKLSEVTLSDTKWSWVDVTVNKSQNTPNKPSVAMNVANSCKKVSDVTLPTDWVWQDADKDTALTVGTAVTATAVYNGADAGNYVNETVSVTITRSACEHNYTGKVITEPTTDSEGVMTCTCGRCYRQRRPGCHQG